jgi:hypothetical protein
MAKPAAFRRAQGPTSFAPFLVGNRVESGT